MEKKGYIAISSMLVIAAVVLVIGISVSLTSVNEIQTALSGKKAEELVTLVDGCAEDTLLYLNERNELPLSVSSPEGSCTVTLENQSGTNWTFLVSADNGEYQKRIRIVANRDSSLSIVTWTYVQ